MTERRGAMTAQQFWDSRLGKTRGRAHTKRPFTIHFDRVMEFADALSARNTAQVTQDRDDARQRLADYESADLQTIEAHAKELADHEKEVAELRTASKQDELRLREAAERAGVGWFGCDTPDHLAEKVLELRAALRKYGAHSFGCPVTMTGASDCYCGLEEAGK